MRAQFKCERTEEGSKIDVETTKVRELKRAKDASTLPEGKCMHLIEKEWHSVGGGSFSGSGGWFHATDGARIRIVGGWAREVYGSPFLMNFRATVANKPVAVLRRLVPEKARQPIFFFLNKVLGRLEGELDLVPKLTERKRTAIDIGASSGYYTYVMAKHFARVEAFEPIPANTRNLEDYGSARIHVNHVALGSVSGRVKIHLPIVDGTGSYGTASVSEPRNGKFEVLDVESKRLDEFEFEEVDLIKIDVEGHEFEVLRGAQKTIERNRPVLIMEILNRNKAQVEAFFGELSGGYRPHILAEDGGLKPLVGGLRDPAVKTVNFIYKPE